MKRGRIALAAAVVCAGASTAWASGGGGDGFFAKNALLLENLVAVVNFLIFVYIVVRFAGPPVRAMFASGAAEYKAKVAEAERALADARAAHDHWAKRQAEMDAEIASIRETAIRMAETQARDIVANAQALAERLVVDARRGAESELARSVEQMRAELVDSVVEKTEEKLRARLTPSHQKMLIEEAIKKLEARS